MKVSVVIAGSSGERVLGNCLSSVRSSGIEDVELVVLPCDQAKMFQIRAQGIEQASGDRVAVLGDRYEVTSGWFQALSGSNHDVAAGCVAPGSCLDYWGWCVFLCEYAHVAPPIGGGAARQAKQVPGGNVVYSREIVHRFPPSQARSEWSFHATLITAGVNVEICPKLEVRFVSPPAFWEYVHERLFLSRAIGEQGGVQKIPIALALPVVLPLRIAAAVITKRRYRLRFALCFPVILFLAVVQAAGELVGAFSTLGEHHE
jgi:hypothetical protein